MRIKSKGVFTFFAAYFFIGALVHQDKVNAMLILILYGFVMMIDFILNGGKRATRKAVEQELINSIEEFSSAGDDGVGEDSC